MSFITVDILKKIAPRANLNIITDLAKFADIYFAKYKVDNYLRVCHFLAQAAHESDGFKTLTEYASGREYEGRHDLGNVQAGDGVRYKGRGIFQLTGRANYSTMSKTLGVDLVGHPELAATGEISLETALDYWNSHLLSGYADNDDVRTITRRINGGYNGLDSRIAYLKIAKSIVPKSIGFTTVSNDTITGSSNVVTAGPYHMNIVMAKQGDNSDYVKSLQDMLNKKGATLTADGAFGPKTKQAVIDFQTKNGLTASGVIDTDTINILIK